MYHYVRGSHVVRAGALHRRRFQLGGGILLAAILPWLVRVAIDPLLVTDPPVNISTIGNICAITFGYYLFRSLTVFPGIRTSNYILPVFSASYAVTLLAFLLFRLEYSRFLLISGYACCIAWYYCIFFLAQRKGTIRIAIVPFGDVDSIKKVERVDWTVLEKPSAIAAIACDALVADFRADLPDEWERFLADAALDGMAVYHVKQLRESLTGKVEIVHLSENSFGSLIPALVYVRFKALGDLVLALISSVLLLPIFLIFSFLIKWDSPGPVIFRQRRIGYGGRPFMVYKFRTMRHEMSDVAADCRTNAMTHAGDARVTRLGRFLRRSRIDELPQIANILRGEMSWIGPRPEAEVLSRWYEAELPFYRYRHIVKPGITGWAQVNQGHVAEVDDVFWKLQYDFYYIKQFSLWLDILITFRTLKTVITGFGSR